MADRKFDLKESAVEAFYAAKELVEGLLADFQARDRFFKYKAGIIGLWVLLSFTTLAVACPGQGGPADNSLQAKVLVSKVRAAGDEEVSILVENESSDGWKDVKLTLNGSYTAYVPELAPGGRSVLTLKQFAGAGGAVPPKDLRPALMKIACSEGKATIDLTQPPPQ